MPTTLANLPKAFLAFLLVGLIFVLVMTAPYLLAVFLGWILATVLRPFHRFLVRKGWPAGRAALAGALTATFAIILPILGLGFLTLKNLIRAVAPYAKDGLDSDVWVARIERLPLAHKFFDGTEEIRVFFEENSKKAIAVVVNALTGVLGAAPELALQLTLALLGCYFMLRDGRRLCEWMSPRMPLPPKTQTDLAKTLDATAYSSFLSMFFASLVQSLIVFVGFLVLKVPMAMLALGIAFVAAWFPIFGVTPVWIAATIFLFANDRPGAAVGMIAFGLAASIADNVVRPWVMKDRDDIHPFVSLVAIFGAIFYFGIIGVLVGPVVAGCFVEILRIWPNFAGDLGLKATVKAAPGATVK